MTDMHTLLSEMRAFAARHGISTATLSTRAAGDGKFYTRLNAGGEALPRTVKRVRDYMANADKAAGSTATGAAAAPHEKAVNPATAARGVG